MPVSYLDYYNNDELRTAINGEYFKEHAELMRNCGVRHGNKRHYEAAMKVKNRKSDRQKLKQKQFILGS